MKYLVMECHPGYAVVLDEQGCFRKAANLRYEVGQTVTDITEFSTPAPVQKGRRISSLAAIAACFVMLAAFLFSPGRQACASVYLTINPQVRIDVNWEDIVVGLEGINDDGKALIQDYSFQRKELNLVVDELVDLAIGMDYLQEGGRITLDLDADEQWITSHATALESHLSEHLEQHLHATVEVGHCAEPEHSHVHGRQEPDVDDPEDDADDFDDRDDPDHDFDDPDDDDLDDTDYDDHGEEDHEDRDHDDDRDEHDDPDHDDDRDDHDDPDHDDDRDDHDEEDHDDDRDDHNDRHDDDDHDD